MNAQKHSPNAPLLTDLKSLKTLVENRTVYSLDNCELNLFETYRESAMFSLKFNDFVVTSMLRGKKVMHLFDEPGFDYLPGETIIVPSNVEMKIDFPEASSTNPTQCLALAIDHNKITKTIDFLNEHYPKADKMPWHLDYENYFFYNNIEMASTISKLITECTSTSAGKDVLANLTLQELLVRIMQTQSVGESSVKTENKQTGLIQETAEHIRKNINEDINLKSLSEKAGMSATTFYRYFKREMGMSPIEFILAEKVKYAKSLLKHPGIQVNEVCYMTGFEDCNYFIRLFKKHEGITPKQYQLLYIN